MLIDRCLLSSKCVFLLQILSQNRALAINLFLKKYNFTDPQSLTKIIRSGKNELTAESLRTLLKALPTSEEVKYKNLNIQIQKFSFQIELVNGHPPEQWAIPEQFVSQMSAISHYTFRVNTLILISEFDETFDDYKRKFQHIIRVIGFLQNETSIKQLARSLLSIGDFLNYVELSYYSDSETKNNRFLGFIRWQCLWFSY